jgi:hypothetical protein
MFSHAHLRQRNHHLKEVERVGHEHSRVELSGYQRLLEDRNFLVSTRIPTSCGFLELDLHLLANTHSAISKEPAPTLILLSITRTTSRTLRTTLHTLGAMSKRRRRQKSLSPVSSEGTISPPPSAHPTSSESEDQDSELETPPRQSLVHRGPTIDDRIMRRLDMDWETRNLRHHQRRFGRYVSYPQPARDPPSLPRDSSLVQPMTLFEALRMRDERSREAHREELRALVARREARGRAEVANILLYENARTMGCMNRTPILC